MKGPSKQSPSSVKHADGVELNAAKNIFFGMELVCKHLSFYPHNHTICTKSIYELHSLMGTFSPRYGTLRFEIERERIIYKDGLISEGAPQEGTLHFAFFHVGIRWLEFLGGIRLEEIRDILLILYNYCKITADSDGDIVTAFWKAQFPHLRYEVDEFSWFDDQDKTEDILDPHSEKKIEAPRTGYREVPGIQDFQALTHADVVLTAQEKAIIKETIHTEERENKSFYLEALMDSLLGYREKESFNVIIGVLTGEYTTALVQRDFIAAFKILHGLRSVLERFKREFPQGVPYLEAFFLNASRESHAALIEIWKQLDSEDAGILGQVLKLLHPQMIQTLCALLQLAQSVPLRQVLLDSIFFLASEDINPLESILNNEDEPLIEQLVPIISKLEGEKSLRCLIRLARHPAAHIRNMAIQRILLKDPERAKELIHAIDKMDKETRSLVLEQLGRTRDISVEENLLAYLRSIKFEKNEIDYLFLCFRTLGKCGSARSIPFLRETLLKGGLIPGFRKSALRTGAAIALLTMDLPEAEMVLQEASHSLNPGLRIAVGQVRQEFRPGRRR